MVARGSQQRRTRHIRWRGSTMTAGGGGRGMGLYPVQPATCNLEVAGMAGIKLGCATSGDTPALVPELTALELHAEHSERSS